MLAKVPDARETRDVDLLERAAATASDPLPEALPFLRDSNSRVKGSTFGIYGKMPPLNAC